MALCPKCGQESTNEKFCSNCWASMTVKPKAEKKEQNPFRNLIIVAVFLIIFGLAMSYLANMMRPADAPLQATPTTPAQAPVPTDTPSVPTTGETPPPPFSIEPTDTPVPAVSEEPSSSAPMFR